MERGTIHPWRLAVVERTSALIGGIGIGPSTVRKVSCKQHRMYNYGIATVIALWSHRTKSS
jgi:hypothetical protein